MIRSSWTRCLLIILIAILTFAISPTPASANDNEGSVLVAEFTWSTPSSIGCVDPGQVGNAMVFTLYYGFDGFYGGDTSYGIDADLEIGGITEWSPGQTGLIDLTLKNTPDFEPFVSNLTNNFDEMLSAGELSIAEEGASFPGSFIAPGSGVGSDLESNIFEDAYDDFNGANITFIRLIVNAVSISYDGCTASYNSSGTWQFWGSKADPAVRIGALEETVSNLPIANGVKNGLLAKLKAAQRSAARGQDSATCGQLGAFINQVKAKSGSIFTVEQAEKLIQRADDIRTQIGCN